MAAKALSKTVTAIRAEYPHPTDTVTVENSGSCYCVGGAYLMAVDAVLEGDESASFPEPETLARVLEENGVKNPLAAAQKIIDYNDVGEFEAAWDALDAALRSAGEA